MKKAGWILTIAAAIYGFYEQSKPQPNVWISASCFVIQMLGLLFLNKKTPGNFEKNEDENDSERR